MKGKFGWVVAAAAILGLALAIPGGTEAKMKVNLNPA